MLESTMPPKWNWCTGKMLGNERGLAPNMRWPTFCSSSETPMAVTSPGRLEIIRRSPTILLDVAHNPHGAEAVGAAVEDSFSFSPLVAVVSVMADKDAAGLLEALESHVSQVVCTQNSTDRSMSAVALGRVASEVFGEDRVSVVADLATAIDRAATLAEAGEMIDSSIGSGAVLITGSVVSAGEARTMLKGRR